MRKKLRSGWWCVIFMSFVVFPCLLDWDKPPEPAVPERPTMELASCSAPVKAYYDIPLSRGLQDYTRSVCESYGVPFELALSVMYVESSFQADARNGQCYGLMQIHKCNFEWLTKEIGTVDYMDAEENILAGVFMLSEIISEYDGDLDKALTVYNRGCKGAAGMEESSYSNKVLAYMNNLKERR